VSRRKSARPVSNDPVGDAAFEAAMLERWPKPDPLSIGLRVATLVAVFGFTWHAIHHRGATAGALLLPMAGEIAAGVLIGFALAATVVRDAQFRKEVVSGVRFWVIVAIVFLAWSWFRADRAQIGLDRQLMLTVSTIADYVRVQGMLWPMLAAGVGLVAATAGDVAAYRRKGPPFVFLGSLSLGLRLFVLIVAGFGFLVAADASRRNRAELMWCVLLAGEAFALWAPYVVQKKIREEHAAERAERDARRKKK
jgi:hypothetical protein